MKLKGRVAIVTGGGRGIGRAVALAFAREGANLVLAAKTASEIEAVASEVEALGQEALAVATDVGLKDQVDAMAAAAYDRFGPVDTKMRRDNHPDDDLEKLTLPEDVADLVLFLVTQPARAHTLEAVIRTPLM